jgi:hypothetical protein
MESKTEKAPDKLCFIVTHIEQINGNEYSVYHYQEEQPSDAVMAILREDALIKCQLRAGESNKG